MLIVYLDAMKRNAYIIADYNNLLNNYPNIIKPINWVVFHYFDKYSFNGSMFEMFDLNLKLKYFKKIKTCLSQY